MIKIAFIKYAGLASSGTEKFLQNIAMLLPKDEFEVDYYYCDSTPYIGSNLKHPDNDPLNIKPMIDGGVNLIKFKVESKDVTKRNHPWINSNFFQIFKGNYDLIQTGRAGNPEYPFNKIKKIPIVDSIHIMGGIDNQYNISRVMHITNWSAKKWIKKGGDRNRVRIISHPIIIDEKDSQSLREDLNLSDNIVVYGFHQRNSDEIFSDIPLKAYKEIESNNNYFIILGGSNLYKEQARKLGIKNIIFLDHTGDKTKIYSFLKTLNVYAHGRKDGEINSTAMAEAMYFGLPIISHISKVHNGHIECIGNAGKVVDDIDQYVEELKKFNDKSYLNSIKILAKKRFEELYSPKRQIDNIISIYKEVVSDPYPNKIKRFISSFRVKFYIYKIFEKLSKYKLSNYLFSKS